MNKLYKLGIFAFILYLLYQSGTMYYLIIIGCIVIILINFLLIWLKNKIVEFDKREKENVYMKKEDLSEDVLPAFNNASKKNNMIRLHVDDDESIININSRSYDLNIYSDADNNDENNVPKWTHTYVYSYNEIENASSLQKQFYLQFKERFLKGELVDINNNTNYAFVLYFNLLNDYESHGDLELLEKQLILLGEICPKTRRYSLHSLQQLLKKKGDANSLARLDDLNNSNYELQYGSLDYTSSYSLGELYKSKLGLNKEEVSLLNKFSNPSNSFTAIEGCRLAVVKQYLYVMYELTKEGFSIEDELVFFKEKKLELNKQLYNNSWINWDNSYYKKQAESEVYLTIFKRVENSVREFFRHKRKVSGEYPCAHNQLNIEFQRRIGDQLDQTIALLENKIEAPNLLTEIELNARNVNRWKEDFSNLKKIFNKKNINVFNNSMDQLEKANVKNINIENIFYDTSKFMAKYDKINSLKYYVKYIHYDLKSKKINNKELSKTIQKSLFKSEEEINYFKQIIANLVSNNDLNQALTAVPNVYVKKRKKISINKKEVENIEQNYSGTVELLSDYLSEDKDKNIPVGKNGNEIDEVEVYPAAKKRSSSFNSEIHLDELQEKLILLIEEKSFEIPQSEVEAFALQNGMFKNQFVDGINEACYEFLDDEPLIEEDDMNYIIEKVYFDKIINR